MLFLLFEIVVAQVNLVCFSHLWLDRDGGKGSQWGWDCKDAAKK